MKPPAGHRFVRYGGMPPWHIARDGAYRALCGAFVGIVERPDGEELRPLSRPVLFGNATVCAACRAREGGAQPVAIHE